MAKSRWCHKTCRRTVNSIRSSEIKLGANDLHFFAFVDVESIISNAKLITQARNELSKANQVDLQLPRELEPFLRRWTAQETTILAAQQQEEEGPGERHGQSAGQLQLGIAQKLVVSKNFYCQQTVAQSTCEKVDKANGKLFADKRRKHLIIEIGG